MCIAIYIYVEMCAAGLLAWTLDAKSGVRIISVETTLAPNSFNCGAKVA
jgi:hypothetical protein